MQNHHSLKFLAAIIFVWLFQGALLAQQATNIHTSGSYIIGVCGDTIVPHGINYAPYNWGYDNTQLLLNEVAKSGANIVRMSWYANKTAPYYTDALLDSAIGTCIKNKMIPVIELHDNTCLNDYDSLIRLAAWYTAPSRLNIISKYKSSLIINIANEAGYVNWDGDPAQAQQSYQNAYDSIARLLRANNINVPLLIDAPDCGTSIDVFGNVAANMINADPQHNLIFSAHAYWYAYANNDSATMRQKITSALSYSFPVVLGEVANQQDDAQPCEYTLNYTALLHICAELKVGWLAWSWNNDDCPNRQVSNDGTYANLTTYGTDIVNNTVYGLHNVATLTSYLANNQAACAAASVTLRDTINTTICQGSNYYGYTAAGTYIDTFALTGGNDSIRTLNLQVATTIADTINATICTGANYDGHAVTGTYIDTFRATGGCDSIRTLNLQVDSFPAIPVIVQHGDTLTTTQSFSQYYWYNGSGVSTGDSSSLLVISQNGNYYVQVTNSGSPCRTASAIYTGIENPALNTQHPSLAIYPNPASSVLNMQLTGLLTDNEITVRLYNTTGALVFDKTQAPCTTCNLHINLEDIAAGLYLVQLRQNNWNISRRVMIIK